MRLTITHKLFAAFLLATGLVVILMLGFSSWSFQRGFSQFIETRQQQRIDQLSNRLADIYATEGNWQGLVNETDRWRRLLWSDQNNRSLRRLPPWLKHSRYHHDNEEDDDEHDDEYEDYRDKRYRPLEFRVLLLDQQQRILIGPTGINTDSLKLHPVKLEQDIVGYLGIQPGPVWEKLGEVNFLERQIRWFLLFGLAAVLLSAVLAVMLARRLVRPLNEFTQASRELADGNYGTRITVRSNDELGRLAQDFNHLAEVLSHTEQQRRAWVADISHELRTPVAVLRAEIEALLDGVRKADANALASLHSDTLRLQRLIDDLYELSLSDIGALQYRMQSIQPVSILQADLDAMASEFEQRRLSIHLNKLIADDLTMHGDPDRLSQLFRNLLSNAAHYTDAGGRVEIQLTRNNDKLLLDIQDTAPGVPESELPKLFDRLYRVEASRSRSLGGAGLGLAISKNIVAAHQGRISARPSPMGGLWLQVELPLEPS